MAKKEETKELKETTKEAPKKEAPKKEAPAEAKKEKKEDKKHEGKGEEHAKKDRKGAPKEGKKEAAKPKETGPEIKHIVRIADTDLDGKRSVQSALTSIKGVSRRIAKIVAVHSGIEPKTTIGYLEDASIEKLQKSIDSIPMIVPFWMMNKQNDFMTGEDKHLIGVDVMTGLNEDLNLMKKMRSYKGVRHDKGLKVRGQRTRSTGRKGRTVGVSRSALQGKAAAAKEEKKPEAKGAGK